MTPVYLQEQTPEENLAVEPIAKQLLRPVMWLHDINVILQLYESSVKDLLLVMFFHVDDLKNSAEQKPGCLFYWNNTDLAEPFRQQANFFVCSQTKFVLHSFSVGAFTSLLH